MRVIFIHFIYFYLKNDFLNSTLAKKEYSPYYDQHTYFYKSVDESENLKLNYASKEKQHSNMCNKNVLKKINFLRLKINNIDNIDHFDFYQLGKNLQEIYLEFKNNDKNYLVYCVEYYKSAYISLEEVLKKLYIYHSSDLKYIHSQVLAHMLDYRNDIKHKINQISNYEKVYKYHIRTIYNKQNIDFDDLFLNLKSTAIHTNLAQKYKRAFESFSTKLYIYLRKINKLNNSLNEAQNFYNKFLLHLQMNYNLLSNQSDIKYVNLYYVLQEKERKIENFIVSWKSENKKLHKDYNDTEKIFHVIQGEAGILKNLLPKIANISKSEIFKKMLLFNYFELYDLISINKRLKSSCSLFNFSIGITNKYVNFLWRRYNHFYFNVNENCKEIYKVYNHPGEKTEKIKNLIYAICKIHMFFKLEFDILYEIPKTIIYNSR